MYAILVPDAECHLESLEAGNIQLTERALHGDLSATITVEIAENTNPLIAFNSHPKDLGDMRVTLQWRP